MLGLFIAITTVAVVNMQSGVGCLDAVAIESRLQQLIPPSSVPHQATLESAESGVRVSLRDADGVLIASRVLLERDDCTQMQNLVAVTIASWETAVPEPNESPIALPVPPPMSSTAGVVVVAPRRATEWEVDAAVLGSIASGAFAAGATADVLLGKRAFSLGVRLGVAGMGTRELVLGSGQAKWGRVAATISPNLELATKLVRVELHADVLLGSLFMQGAGFSSNGSANAFDLGLGGGLRASLMRWSVQPWADVSLLGWVAHQNATAMVDGTRVTAEIPRFDIWVRVGVAYGRGR